MVVNDALRALLRGCKRPKIHREHESSKQPAQSSQLPPELDFFKTGNPTSASDDTLHPEFSKLVTQPRIRNALIKLAVKDPTPVQRRAIPRFNTNDVVAIAPTGSGKTLAYLLPLLATLLEPSNVKKPRALVIAPTRELSEQIARVATRLIDLGKLNIRYNALISKAATAALKAASGKVHLIVATPLRLQYALDQGAVDLSRVKHIILDEADELLTDNFVSQIDTLLAACDKPRVHMFSATLPPRIDQLAAGLLRDMHKVVVDGGAFGGSAAVNDLHKSIEQKFVFVGGRGEQGKVLAVRSMFKNGMRPPVLVFVQSKERAAELFRELVYDGVRVDAIHADRTAAARASAVARFRAGEIWVLIATDVLGRGLDFLAVSTVINYDMPSSGAAYVHRIGRTGRNGRHGCAITLFTEEDEKLVGGVVKVAKASGADIPDWLMKIAGRIRNDEIRRIETRPPTRKRVGGPNRSSLKRSRKRKRVESDTT